MTPLYEIDFTQKKFEQYLRVYDNYIEIRKVEQNGRLASIFHPTFLDFVSRIDMLERVELVPANGRLATGILQFIKKGEPSKKATKMNYLFLANTFNFTAKQNDVARQIYEYVQSKIGGGAR